jgi:quinol monooxygenase YgiN
MTRFLLLLLSTVIAAPGIRAQTGAGTPADTAFHTVTYVEVMPSSSSRSTAIAAFKEYRTVSRKQDGNLRFELYEQVGRPGHFVILETWRDQKAFDGREVVSRKQLLDVLQPIRVSDYDQRPYKTLAVGSSSTSVNRNTVYVITHVDIANNPQVPAWLQRLAEASRQDQGNLRFDVLQGTTRMNHFTVIEAWQNQKALDAHVAASHTKQYRDELGPFTGSPLDENVYEAIQ